MYDLTNLSSAEYVSMVLPYISFLQNSFRFLVCDYIQINTIEKNIPVMFICPFIRVFPFISTNNVQTSLKYRESIV